MRLLETYHALLHSSVGQTAGKLESLDVWRAAEAHRMRWRPEVVRTLLLAESHVFTGAEEAMLRVRLPSGSASDVPDAFVRLVYCLGYGEDELLNGTVTACSNSGTPQFWKIFLSCLQRIESSRDFAPVLKTGTRNLQQRIANKLAVLEQLRTEGVWLLDASLAALYDSGNKPEPSFQRTCIEVSWPYVSGLIEEAHPEQIIVIGKGVGRTLEDKLRQLKVPVHVVKQPQAMRSAQEQIPYYQQFYDLVHGSKVVRAPKGIFSQSNARPRKTQPVRRQRDGESTRRWTLNNANGSHYHGVVPLSASPFHLELSFREDARSAVQYIGSFELDLPLLLEQGCIRYEPAGSVSDRVRVRVAHLGGLRFGLQTNRSGPLHLLTREMELD